MNRVIRILGRYLLRPSSCASLTPHRSGPTKVANEWCHAYKFLIIGMYHAITRFLEKRHMDKVRADARGKRRVEPSPFPPPPPPRAQVDELVRALDSLAPELADAHVPPALAAAHQQRLQEAAAAADSSGKRSASKSPAPLFTAANSLTTRVLRLLLSGGIDCCVTEVPAAHSAWVRDSNLNLAVADVQRLLK